MSTVQQLVAKYRSLIETEVFNRSNESKIHNDHIGFDSDLSIVNGCNEENCKKNSINGRSRMLVAGGTRQGTFVSQMLLVFKEGMHFQCYYTDDMHNYEVLYALEFLVYVHKV